VPLHTTYVSSRHRYLGLHALESNAWVRLRHLARLWDADSGRDDPERVIRADAGIWILHVCMYFKVIVLGAYLRHRLFAAEGYLMALERHEPRSQSYDRKLQLQRCKKTYSTANGLVCFNVIIIFFSNLKKKHSDLQQRQCCSWKCSSGMQL
jgi:hypothetical protein